LVANEIDIRALLDNEWVTVLEWIAPYMRINEKLVHGGLSA
jgi:hypothetical protein